MELRFALFVLLELGAHVLSDLLLLEFHLLDDSIVFLLFCGILFLNVCHSLADGSEFLNAGRQLCLLFFNLLFDLLNEGGKFL